MIVKFGETTYNRIAGSSGLKELAICILESGPKRKRMFRSRYQARRENHFYVHGIPRAQISFIQARRSVEAFYHLDHMSITCQSHSDVGKSGKRHRNLSSSTSLSYPSRPASSDRRISPREHPGGLGTTCSNQEQQVCEDSTEVRSLGIQLG